ncbi:hypothetical protein ACGF12_13770 [Kitasatospora sp. NPDC048296]|uniref:hypothetical protein n=1 Tax=Kitasatospora sp. NPDC048296 TaxID=3364048 RepID=UPI003722B139
MTSSADPLATADTLWKQLIEHQPAVAAALAMQLRALPANWAQRELGVARPHAALELPAGADVPMEIAPYRADWEDCPACIECEELCRYHAGRSDGYEALHRPLREACVVDPAVTVANVFERLEAAEEAAESGELAAAVARLIAGQQG